MKEWIKVGSSAFCAYVDKSDGYQTTVEQFKIKSISKQFVILENSGMSVEFRERFGHEQFEQMFSQNINEALDNLTSLLEARKQECRREERRLIDQINLVITDQNDKSYMHITVGKKKKFTL